jgi:hypothetical protein
MGFKVKGKKQGAMPASFSEIVVAAIEVRGNPKLLPSARR